MRVDEGRNRARNMVRSPPQVRLRGGPVRSESPRPLGETERLRANVGFGLLWPVWWSRYEDSAAAWLSGLANPWATRRRTRVEVVYAFDGSVGDSSAAVEAKISCAPVFPETRLVESWEEQVLIRRRLGSGLSGWCQSIGGIIVLSGRRSVRLLRCSGVRRRRCASGCAKPRPTRARLPVGCLGYESRSEVCADPGGGRPRCR